MKIVSAKMRTALPAYVRRNGRSPAADRRLTRGRFRPARVRPWGGDTMGRTVTASPMLVGG